MRSIKLREPRDAYPIALGAILTRGSFVYTLPRKRARETARHIRRATVASWGFRDE